MARGTLTISGFPLRLRASATFALQMPYRDNETMIQAAFSIIRKQKKNKRGRYPFQALGTQYFLQ